MSVYQNNEDSINKNKKVKTTVFLQFPSGYNDSLLFAITLFIIMMVVYERTFISRQCSLNVKVKTCEVEKHEGLQD